MEAIREQGKINYENQSAKHNLDNIRIMIADDSSFTRKILRMHIEDFSNPQIMECCDGINCVETFQDFKPDIVIIDYEMPGLNGLEVISKIREFSSDAFFLMITASENSELKLKALQSGVNDFIRKPVNALELSARLINAAELINSRKLLNEKADLLKYEVMKATVEIKCREFESLQLLGAVSNCNDETTGKHIIRVASYAKTIAKELGMDEEYQDLIYHASPLHDIGKIGISDSILNKKGKLNEDEFLKMQQHTEFGHQMLHKSESKYLRMGAEISLSHHERFDGKGYPNNLEKEDIPLSGRIVAIADVFDALTTARPYKKAWYFTDAVKYIDQEKSKNFDPVLVDVFKSALEEIVSHYFKYNS